MSQKYANMILPNKFADNLFKKSINLDTIKQVKGLTSEKVFWKHVIFQWMCIILKNFFIFYYI